MRYSRLFVFSVLIAHTAAFAQRPSPERRPSTSSSSAVVRVRAVDPSGAMRLGVGVVVGEHGLIATEHALLTGAETISVVDPATNSAHSAELVTIDSSTGIAILSASGVTQQPLRLTRRVPVRGEAVQMLVLDTLDAPSMQLSRVTRITQFTDGTLIELEGSLGGDSNGAPVLSDQGEMVAIAYSAEDQERTALFGIPSRDVLGVLEKAGLVAAPAPIVANSPVPPRVAAPMARPGSASLPMARPGSASFWMHQGGPVPDDARTIGTEDLIGKTFLFVPSLSSDARPRYDYRMLMTFQPSGIELLGPFVSGRYSLEYESTRFRSVELGSDMAYYASVAYSDERIHLNANPPGDRSSFSLGMLRPLTQNQGVLLRAHLARVEREEVARRQVEARSAASSPLPFIDTSDLPGSGVSGRTISRIYYGQFSELFGEDGQNSLARLNGLTVVRHIFTTYHEQYYEVYGDDMPEPSTSIRTDRVKTENGYERQRDSLYSIRVRTRFSNAYLAAQPTTADVLAMAFRSFDSERKQIDLRRFMEEAQQGPALRAFIERYRTSSPATLARFEENLYRAVLLQPPLLIREPGERFDPGEYPWLLPGESISATAESSAERGISWTRPARWERRARGYGLVVWDVGPKFFAQVILDVSDTTVTDLLPYINSFREKQSLERVAVESDQPAERFEIDGRRAILMSFRLATNVMILDGSRTWFVTVYGNTNAVRDAMPEFREFLQSLRFGSPVARE